MVLRSLGARIIRIICGDTASSAAFPGFLMVVGQHRVGGPLRQPQIRARQAILGLSDPKRQPRASELPRARMPCLEPLP
jgi:hypothetical protein